MRDLHFKFCIGKEERSLGWLGFFSNEIVSGAPAEGDVKEVPTCMEQGASSFLYDEDKELSAGKTSFPHGLPLVNTGVAGLVADDDKTGQPGGADVMARFPDLVGVMNGLSRLGGDVMPGLPDRIADVLMGLVADVVTGLSGVFVVVLIGLVLVA